MRITPNNITELKENEIFVFGSNTQGRHGKGAALIAKEKFGAIYGQSEGLQGQSYAIVTKELRPYVSEIQLWKIKEDVEEFIQFAKERQDLIFLVTPIGCGLGGFKSKEIAPLFQEALKLENVYLPIEFITEIKLLNLKQTSLPHSIHFQILNQ